uniref:Plasmid recombination enzyme n=1 Tax=Globodera pallida TaxID=36090 RepID=A0A183CL14_GLOPA
MAFAILRVKKMNTMGAIAGKDSHELRQRETLNADVAKESLNRQVIGTNAADDVRERLAATSVPVRKDSVLAIDVFATASPEFFKKNHPDDAACRAFQKSLVYFLEKEFGKENVVSLRAHHDETSPHWHATIVPIREKMIKVGRSVKTERKELRLCAKDWLGGDRHTLSKLQTRFADSVNRSVDQARRGELAKAATPAIDALVQKATDRQSQAEQALLSLGYRLDQHGQLINIEVEREEAIKKTVEHFLQDTTSEQNFFQELAKRGIRIEQGEGDIYYQDGKGEPVASQKLGERYSAGGLLEQIHNNQVEQSSRQSYERIMAGIFANLKGSAPQVSTYLKSLGEDDIRQICEGIARDSGPGGADHARKWLERDMAKNAMELAGYRQQLRKQGLDAGKDRGMSLGW